MLNRFGKVEHEIETLNDKVSSTTASTIHVSPTEQAAQTPQLETSGSRNTCSESVSIDTRAHYNQQDLPQDTLNGSLFMVEDE